VITGEEGTPLPRDLALPVRKRIDYRPYLITVLVVAVCGLLGWLGYRLRLADEANANVVMVFLAGVALIAARFGRGPAIAAAVLSVLVFDFFFVRPYYTFAVSDTKYIITFVVMLGIGLLISALTSRLQAQLRASQQQEHRTAQLFRMTRQLSELSGTDFLLQTAGRQLQEIFDGEVVVFLREPNRSLQLRFGENTSVAKQPMNAVVADWVAENNKTAGLKTDTLPNATALFVPLIGSQKTAGALGVRPNDTDRFLDADQRRLLETCASLVALSIERDQSVLDAQQAQVQVEAEQLRNSLLSSVSHDLRTPLATIAGTAASLLENGDQAGSQSRPEMLQTLVDESHQVVRLVDNLLEMARLDAGAVALNQQWHVLEELVGSALHRLRMELAPRTVRVSIPSDYPLLLIDGFLMEQVFVNLLENASRYTPAGATIEISAAVAGKRTDIRFADNGPGLPRGSESRVFDKFFRGSTNPPDGRRGVGLGLAICQGIVTAMGGRITATNRPEGGAEFVISLSCQQQTPRIALEECPAPAGA
jgi:two-component system sensor histidine kinase KdpD